MKKNIRWGLFETNSSMSISLYIMSEKEYEAFLEHEKDDDWVWNSDVEQWMTKEDMISTINPDIVEYYDFDTDDLPYPYSRSAFGGGVEYETKEYVTEHGDKVVAISGACIDY